jgi:hypothetical protein
MLLHKTTRQIQIEVEVEDGWAAEGTSSVASDSINPPISIATSSQLRSLRGVNIETHVALGLHNNAPSLRAQNTQIQ